MAVIAGAPDVNGVGVYMNPLNQAPGDPPPAPAALRAAAASGPSFDHHLDPLAPTQPGSYVLGFVAAFLFSFIGLLIAHTYGKHESSRGAVHGFLAALAFTGIRLLTMLAAE